MKKFSGFVEYFAGKTKFFENGGIGEILLLLGFRKIGPRLRDDAFSTDKAPFPRGNGGFQIFKKGLKFFDRSLKCTNLFIPLFLLPEVGPKEKAWQKEKPRGISPSADGDEGSAPSTAPPFEKGGRKLLRKLLSVLAFST